MTSGSVAVREPPPGPSGAGDAPTRPAPSALPLVAFVLGLSGVVLGATIVWYFAAFPLGLAAIVVGIVAVRRAHESPDPRARSRAAIGTVLGFVAIVLAVSAAYMLPRTVDAIDEFFTSMQDDVNANVDSVNDGLRDDVRSLDRTVTRDLDRLEAQNQRDLTEFDNRTAATLGELEARIGESIRQLDTAVGADLTRLEQSLRDDIRALDAALRAAQQDFATQVSAMEARVRRLEQETGITP